jgi:hypothetical protein
MDIHALAVLAATESQNPPVNRIQQSGAQGDKLQTITLKLLSGFIEESQAYPDSQLLINSGSMLKRAMQACGQTVSSH